MKRLDVVDESRREDHYPRVAELVLSQGVPGSSAAGEQPKFISIVEKKEGLVSVIVKFSPPLVDAISRRVADLLVCEHIAHKVLTKYGKLAPKSCLVSGANKLFLEVERFDRNLSGGRLGVISLRSLDLEFVGELKSWSETAKALYRKKIIDKTSYDAILWLEVFGKLIGNTDRHHGNISFFCDGEKIKGLAPTYDMLPMLYAPQQNQLIDRDFNPGTPKFDEIAVWDEARLAACDFWSQVHAHAQISEEFKTLVAGNGLPLMSLYSNNK